MLDLTLINRSGFTKVSKTDLEAHLCTVLRRLNLVDRVVIELLLVGDKEIKKLNQKFRQAGCATDVLSFASDTAVKSGDNLLGSIVISVETALRQAKAASIALSDELKMLSSHGLLHLLGYNHK